MLKRNHEQKLDRELRFHIDEHVRTLMEQGATEKEARRQAAIEFGGMEQIKDECRDARTWAWCADIGRDLKHGLRVLRRSPGFTAVAIATLALGVGANTAVFSLVHKILIAYLPVEDPGRLVVLSQSNIERNAGGVFSHLFFREIESEQNVLEGALCRGGSERVTVGTEAGGEPAIGELVSGGYFEVLGVKPYVGRLLTPSDDVAPGSHPVVVLSYRYWQRRFGGDLAVVGKILRVSSYPMTVIGVSPPGFDGLDPGQTVDLRIPIAMQAEVRQSPLTLAQRGAAEFNIVGRLKRGVTVEQARQALSAMLTRYLNETRPATEQERRLRASERVELAPAATGFGKTRRQLKTSLWALMSITTAVLLIACFNLANLLLARSAARQREFSIRAAVGASAGRIVRQLLTESLLLSLCGAALGAIVAFLGSTLLMKLASGSGTRLSFEAAPNLEVLLFHLGTAVLVGVLFGLAPALKGLRPDVTQGLTRDAGRRLRTAGQTALLSTQVALSVVVLVGAGMFLRTVQALRSTDMGFRPDHLLLIALDPKNAGRSDAEVAPFFREVKERVSALPGVRRVAFSTVRLMSDSRWTAAAVVEGFNPSAAAPKVARNAVGPDYFGTVGIPLVAGREFTGADDKSAPKVAIVNQSFARLYFGGRNPLGKKIGADVPDHTVVAVAGDAKYAHVREPAPPQWYVPYAQRPKLKNLDLCVRTSGEPESMVHAIRAAIAAVDKNVALFEVRSQNAQIEELLVAERMLAALSTFFGITAASLATLGIYGVLMFLVSQRRREIGIRLALGSRPGAVMRLIAKEAWLSAGLGILAGLPAAMALGQYAQGVLYGVKPLDGVSLAGGVLVVAATATLAALAPALRAAKVDPMTVLRQE